MTDKPIVGIDVSKGWLDACVAGSVAVERIANDREAVGVWLERVGPRLVGFASTSGHERVLVAALCERRIPFTRVHPNDVIAFRKNRGIKAKSDPIDALGLFTARASLNEERLGSALDPRRWLHRRSDRLG